MPRISIKIVGAAGQGLISIGDILAKSFKRAGYCVFGYREFMSLIKGGHSSYQIDVSSKLIRCSEETVNMVIALNHHGFEHNIRDLKKGGVLIHDTAVWEFSVDDQKFLKDHNITVIYVPIGEMLERINAKPILANVVFSAFAWAAVKGDKEHFKAVVGEKFAHKPDVLEANMKAIDEGYEAFKAFEDEVKIKLPKPKKEWEDQLFLTGSQAMGLGVVNAGVRLYAGYPMTPSSPMLNYIAEIQNETGMVIKQAEDEITAVQMASGAMHAGTRAITATSGGGFDLMTETLSLNGIIENPCVVVLAQRPGPATGLPTWTTQGDLLLAINGGHGEFSRCVMSASDSDDAYSLVNEAFNIAEEYQTVVILLTDKQIAEGMYTQRPYDQSPVIRRGKLIVDPAELRQLRSMDRYDPAAKDGVSKRWLPGSEAATYAAQGDEHNGDGSVNETSNNAIEQMDKRMRKSETLKAVLPEPELYVDGKVTEEDPKLDLLIVGWGSTKATLLDVLPDFDGQKIGYLHFTYLWPLKGERFERLQKKAKKIVLIEGNHNGQLGQVIRQETGIKIDDRILKYDGRPFFLNEIHTQLTAHLS